jgi:transcriptional regulator with XRE-family HTH domain
VSKSKVDSIDVQIGNRLKLRRSRLGITQQDLANLLKISFQQVPKYEKGTNRLGPKRLLEVSLALNVPINYFFQDIESYQDREERESNYYGLAEEPTQEDLSIKEDEINNLINHFHTISNSEIRQQILNLVITLSEIEGKSTDKTQSFPKVISNKRIAS